MSSVSFFHSLATGEGFGDLIEFSVSFVSACQTDKHDCSLRSLLRKRGSLSALRRHTCHGLPTHSLSSLSMEETNPCITIKVHMAASLTCDCRATHGSCMHAFLTIPPASHLEAQSAQASFLDAAGQCPSSK